MNEKLNEILKDEAVVKELFAQETAEDAQKFLASKGVEISTKELEELRAAISTQAEGEMDDEQLDKVAGGATVNNLGYNVTDYARKQVIENLRRRIGGNW